MILTWNQNFANIADLVLLKMDFHILAYVAGVFQVMKEGFCTQPSTLVGTFFTAWPILPSFSLDPTLLESTGLAQLRKMTLGTRTPLLPRRPRNRLKNRILNHLAAY